LNVLRPESYERIEFPKAVIFKGEKKRGEGEEEESGMVGRKVKGVKRQRTNLN
jgi:hypothetical protein